MVVRSALVGREPELTTLSGCLDEALRGRPQLVLCQGEAGIGKTRLSAELLSIAADAGGLGAWGPSADSTGTPPYWPWSQIIRGIANTIDLAAISNERGLTSDLAWLAPDVFVAHDRQPSRARSPGDRFRQFDAVARLLRLAGQRMPLVIVLDDVHWADKPTLLLLLHATRSLTDERLFLMVNARVADQRHAQLLTRLAREPLTTSIQLRGLGAPAVRACLRSALGDEPTDSEFGEVVALTAGNPFFVGEVGRAIAQVREGRRFAPVTPTVRDAIRDRLAGLSHEAVRFVGAAAVLGPEFSVRIASTMVGLPVAAGLELADEATRTGLIEADTAPHIYHFTHALVRDAVEAGLGSAQRARLNRAAAEAIERHYAPALGSHVFDLARHWAEAADHGAQARAAAWSERAADEAMRGLAYEDAARLYRQALDLGGGALDDDRTCDLLLAAGRALNLSGDLPGRLVVCLEAAEAAGRAGRPELVAEAALVMEASATAEFDIATRRLCEKALDTLGGQPSALRARVMSRYVETFNFTSELERVEPSSIQALEMAQQCADDGALVAALRAQRLFCSRPERVQERMRLAQRLLGLSHSLKDPQVELSARLWQIDASFELGDFAGVRNEIEALARCAQQVGGPMARFEVIRCRAVLAQAQGRFGDARRLEDEAFSVLVPTDHAVRFVVRSALLPLIGHHVGQDAASLAANSFAGAPEGFAETVGLVADLSAAHTLASAGQLDHAADLYRSLGPVAGWQPPDHVILFSYAYGIALAAAVGSTAELPLLRELLAPHRGHHVVSGITAVAYFGPVELWLGIAARCLGMLDEAASDLAQAEQGCATSGAAGFQVESQLELATVFARRAGPGDRDRALSLLKAAGRQAGSLGMTPFVTRIAELRRQLDETAGTNGLTSREREVAGLVAQGLTNRDIASRLFVSERTAESHVQHILTKLGLSNRSQIAVWVMRRK